MADSRFTIHNSLLRIKHSVVHCSSYIIFCALCIVFSGCHRNYPDQSKEQQEQTKEQLINANKIIVQDQSKAIEEFINRHQWKMQTTGTGLRIQVYEEGSGKKPDLKSSVSIAYKVYLLDGTLCYSFDDQHAQKLPIGSGELTRGLEEGLMMMKEGGKARMVVPYHLAYGFPGDGNKVPSASALHYDVHLLKVE